MSDRVDSFFSQLLTEAELDQMLDQLEQAIWDFASDAGIFGVISGAALTETGPQTMNILSSNPCKSYDQEGRRIYYPDLQTVDCSVDYVGNPTIPAGGKERWLMIVLEFDRNLYNLRQDGNGADVYYNVDEFFVIKVVAGPEVTTPIGSPAADGPTKPTDALVLGDIKIDSATTVITTGMINFTRRDNFQFAAAGAIGVTSGAWTKIDNTVAQLQAALDSIDNELILRDSATGDIEQSLIPKAGTEKLGDSGANEQWASLAVQALAMYGDIDTDAVADRELGTSVANHRFNAHLATLALYGDTTAAAGTEDIGTALKPFATMRATAAEFDTIDPIGGANGILGTDAAGERWYVHSNGMLTSGDILAKVASMDVGSNGQPFDILFANEIRAYKGTLAAAFRLDPIGTGVTITDRFVHALGGHTSVFDSALEWKQISGTTVGARATYGWHYDETSGGGLLLIPLSGIPNGARVVGLKITWFEETGSADLKAQFVKFSDAGARAAIGSLLTIGGTGSWQDKQAFTLGGSTTLNRLSESYAVEVLADAANTEFAVVGVHVTYEIDDIGLAAGI